MKRLDLYGDPSPDLNIGTGEPRLILGGDPSPDLNIGVYPTPAPPGGEEVQGEMAARTVAPTVHGTGSFSPNIVSHVIGSAAPRWKKGRHEAGAAVGAWSPGMLGLMSGVEPISQGKAVAAGAVERWEGAPRASAGGADRWRQGARVSAGSDARWAGARRIAGGAGDRWQQGYLVSVLSAGQWIGLPRVSASDFHRWGAGRRIARGAVERTKGGRRLFRHHFARWQDAKLVLYLARDPPPVITPPGPETIIGPDLCLGYPPSADLSLGRRCPPTQIPALKGYYMLHNLALHRLSDGKPIDASEISVSLDADSWAWTWSATLVGAAALQDVEPSPQGEPVKLAATIDGQVWHLLVEDWSEDRQFGQRSTRISGRGLTAELAAPYILADSGFLQDGRSVQQAFSERLPLGSGWTISWTPGTPDWFLPAGSWTWRAAPIQSIADAAVGVGLVAIPAKASKVLTIQPRYPVLPWAFEDATPELIVSDNAIMRLTRAHAVPSQANAVYVHGYESGGVSARVYRTASAGDLVAESRTSGLITHVDAGRLAGGRVLAAQHEQPQIRSFTIPLGGVFPLVALGSMVEVSGVRGIVNAVAVNARFSDAQVRQTISIGEETPNQWAKWTRVMPRPPLLLGTAETLYSDGTWNVRLIGGGSQRVRGTATAGQQVWIRAGRIEGDAPTLPGYEVEV